MGDGYEPHVDDVAGRLIYSLPVDSSIVSNAFVYPITRRDLEVMLADPYRRAVLEVVARTSLERLMLRGNPEVTKAEFSDIVARVLHAPADELCAYVVRISRAHKIVIDGYVHAAMARHARTAGEDADG